MKNGVILLLFLILSLVFIGGCFEDLGLNYDPSSSGSQDFEQSDIGKIKILKVDPLIIQFIENNLTDSTFTLSRRILRGSGGLLKLGSDYLGFCSLFFDTNALPADTTIQMKWKINDGKFEVEFAPEGLQFSIPIKLKMFYKIADLDHVNEEKLKLFYFDRDANLWKLIGGIADLKTKIFKCEISHFSRYALAYSE